VTMFLLRSMSWLSTWYERLEHKSTKTAPVNQVGHFVVDLRNVAVLSCATFSRVVGCGWSRVLNDQRLFFEV
jgi:hypothetical protein